MGLLLHALAGGGFQDGSPAAGRRCRVGSLAPPPQSPPRGRRRARTPPPQAAFLGYAREQLRSLAGTSVRDYLRRESDLEEETVHAWITAHVAQHREMDIVSGKKKAIKTISRQRGFV
jgi:hypothetical protein